MKNNAQISNGWFDETLFLNNVEYGLYVIKLINIAMSRFKWSNVPDGMDMRYFEKMLVTQGTALMFKDDYLDAYIGLGYAYDGELDMYGIPLVRRAISATGRDYYTRSNLDSVICYNNMMHMSEMPVILNFAEKLWEIDRSIVANARQQKYSTIITVPENQRLTMTNIMQKFEGGQPFIYGNKAMELSQIQTLDLKIPFVSDKLLPVRNSIWNQALSSLGVISGASEKNAVSTMVESFSPFGEIELIRESLTSERVKACEMFNAMYGTDMSVEFNSKIPLAPVERIGGENNGAIYNDTEDSYEYKL